MPSLNKTKKKRGPSLCTLAMKAMGICLGDPGKPYNSGTPPRTPVPAKVHGKNKKTRKLRN
jgi:hypothetical protein